MSSDQNMLWLMGPQDVRWGLPPPLSLVVTFLSDQNTDKAVQRVGGVGEGWEEDRTVQECSPDTVYYVVQRIKEYLVLIMSLF